MSADEHLRPWLAKGMTGCQFAKLIAQKRDRIVTATFAGLAKEDDVSRLFDAGTQGHLPVIAIFEVRMRWSNSCGFCREVTAGDSLETP